MGKQKPLIHGFWSDAHFGHYNEEQNRGIITFERTQFKTIQEHDDYLVNMIESWCNKYREGSKIWFLGDFGSLNYLWIFDRMRHSGFKVYFILGNHDHAADIEKIRDYVDEVYEYPVYLSQKLVISHFPVAVYEDTLNIHGHLHGCNLQDNNHINASIHVSGYKLITDKNIAATFEKLPTFNRRFLYEPWANDYQFTQNKEDVIMNKDGRIDLSASRLLQKLNSDRRKQESDSYKPYIGGLK